MAMKRNQAFLLLGAVVLIVALFGGNLGLFAALQEKGYAECAEQNLSIIGGGQEENQCYSLMERALKLSKITFLRGRICQECSDGTRTECPELTYDGTEDSLIIIDYYGEELEFNTWACSYDYYDENNVRYIGSNNYYGAIPFKTFVLNYGDVYYLTEEPIGLGGGYDKAFFKCIDENTWVYAYSLEKLSTCEEPIGTCSELGGIICEGTKSCSGKYVSAINSDKCCTPDASVGLRGECAYPAEGSGCIFPISDFCVKLWMLLVGIGGILLIVLMKK
ncbi:MAG: hypothetical protein KKB31_05690 [Nanoarchaeota archaeon]|nr:hypothetical protein [Nanoarchaeota archaeon]